MSDASTSRRRVLRLAGSAAVAATAVGAGAGGGDAPAPDGTDPSSRAAPTGATQVDPPFTVLLRDPPAGLAPHDDRDEATRTVVRNAYEGLFGRTADGWITPALATGYERVDDRTLHCDLRTDATFHDGTPVTAEDVAYSIRRVVDGSVDVESPQADSLAGVRDATAVDDSTVAVRVAETGGIVPSELASFGTVVSREWAEANDPDAENATVNGTGPYTLDESAEGTVLRRYADYWGETPSVERVRFRAVPDPGERVSLLAEAREDDTGDLAAHLPLSAVEAARDADGVRLRSTPSTLVTFAAMRDDVAPFDDVRVRRALNLAVDQEAIVSEALDGFGDPTGQPAPPPMVGHATDVEPYPHDPERAATLVEESGYAGASVALRAPSSGYAGVVAMAERVVAAVDALPTLSATLTLEDPGTLIRAVTSDDPPAWFLLGWDNPVFDAGETLPALLAPDGAVGTLDDRRLRDLVERAETESGDVRADTLEEASRRAHEQAPWLFLPRQYDRHAVREGVEWTPRVDGLVDVRAVEPPAEWDEPTTTTPGTATPSGPAFRLRELAVPARVRRDAPIPVEATVANVGGDDGVLTVAVELDGDPAASEGVVLGAGETTTVDLTVAASFVADRGPGEYDLAVTAGDETVTRRLRVVDATVTPSPTATADPGDTTDAPTASDTPTDAGDGNGGSDGGGLPGFGLPAALAGLTGAAALRRWRGDDGEEE